MRSGGPKAWATTRQAQSGGKHYAVACRRPARAKFPDRLSHNGEIKKMSNVSSRVKFIGLAFAFALALAPAAFAQGGNTTTNTSSASARTVASGQKMTIKGVVTRSEEHTSELQSRQYLVCRLLLEKKNTQNTILCTVDSSQL